MGTDPLNEIEAALVDSAATIRSEFTDRGAIDEENPSGEVQLSSDVRADEILLDQFSAIEGIGYYASEEREAIQEIGQGYAVTVDPLDGSSNLGSNNPVGTIVAVFDDTLPAGGNSLVAAWFLLYGPLTTMVGTRGNTVTETVIVDRMVYSERSISLPADPTVYGFGGRLPDWPSAFASFADDIANELKLRYGGAMVADVNQVLTHGGIFAYPALESAVSGKLRLQFEAIPMAAIVEAAGGASSDGQRSLLGIEPDELHQRIPVHLGNTELIDRLERALA